MPQRTKVDGYQANDAGVNLGTLNLLNLKEIATLEKAISFYSSSNCFYF